MEIRKCRICEKQKPISSFHKSKKSRGGFDTRCSECKNKLQRESRATNDGKRKTSAYCTSEKYKKDRITRKINNGHYCKMVQRRIDELDNKSIAGSKYVSRDEALEYGLTRYFDGSTCKRGHISERCTSNRQCLSCVAEKRNSKEYKEAKRDYYNKNKPRLMAKNIESQRERYKRCEKTKASVAARNMLKRVLYQGKMKKYGGTYEILGYSRDDLMSRMESMFTGEMSWDNYGDWHIDHIVPVSWFLEREVFDPSVINALNNLQPLWAADNLSKSNKLDA